MTGVGSHATPETPGSIHEGGELIICANHAIRAAVAAMRATFSRILGEGSIAGVEDTIATVAEIFALQGDERMRELEARFLR